MNLNDLQQLSEDMEDIIKIYTANIDTFIYSDKEVDVWKKAEYWKKFADKKLNAIRKQQRSYRIYKNKEKYDL